GSPRAELGKGERIRDNILELALTKVPESGWTTKTIADAATELGYSPIAHTMAQNGTVDLIGYFMNKALRETRLQVAKSLNP
ncbi:Ubiquinone biosynthesis protein coq9, mitochondrial, partial [Spiromyces aspiralis]